MAQRYYSNIAIATTLVGGINNSDTSIVVASTSGFPASTPFTLSIDYQLATQEVVEVTNVAGTTLTVTRGVDNTSAQSHATSSPVVHAITKRDVSEPNDHIQATTNVHGLAGGAALVGTTTTQTLTGKTISGASNTLTSLPAANVTGTFASVTSAGAVSGTTGTFSGAVSGTTGTFSGAVSGTTLTGSGAVSGTTVTGTSTVQGTNLVPTGLTGATAVSRYVGATASGSPGSGTFAIGDFVIDRTGKLYVCTTGGSPGTWTLVDSTKLPLGGGTLTGGLIGTTAAFSGAVSGTTGTFSGAVSGTTGTFSGAVSGTTGAFSSNVTVTGNLTVSGIGQMLFVRKTADQTVNNSATLVSDSDLTLTPTINATYEVDAFIIYVSNTVPDIKFGFSFPAGATLSWTGGGPDANAVAGHSDIAANVALRQASDFTFSYGGSDAFVSALQVKGVLIMSSTSGSLTARWAQSTANASDTAVKQDSWLKLIRVA